MLYRPEPGGFRRLVPTIKWRRNGSSVVNVARQRADYLRGLVVPRYPCPALRAQQEESMAKSSKPPKSQKPMPKGGKGGGGKRGC